jgi:hypothetical protein
VKRYRILCRDGFDEVRVVLSTVKRTESDLHQIEQGELIVMSAKTNQISLDTVGSGMLPLHTDSVSCFKRRLSCVG